MYNLISTIILSATALALTALSSTLAGKVVLIFIATYIGIDLLGLDPVTFQEVQENPETSLELLWDFLN